MYGLALPVCAQTPSLADIAEKETERRAALDERSKVYTDDDLHGGLRLTTGGITPEAETDSSPPPDEVIPPTDDTQLTPESDVSARDEEYWRDRITSAREDRRRAALVAAALQNRIDG